MPPRNEPPVDCRCRSLGGEPEALLRGVTALDEKGGQSLPPPRRFWVRSGSTRRQTNGGLEGASLPLEQRTTERRNRRAELEKTRHRVCDFKQKQGEKAAGRQAGEQHDRGSLRKRKRACTILASRPEGVGEEKRRGRGRAKMGLLIRACAAPATGS
jgi:hypothetical protein